MIPSHKSQNRMRKPHWLKRSLPSHPNFGMVRGLLDHYGLHTVCQEAKCPNQWECFSNRTATFLIMGSCCTRNCRFCAIEHGSPHRPDAAEPERVARAAAEMGLAYVVVTSVTRDDLPDGGAWFFAETIRQTRRLLPEARLEVLIPDLQGDRPALECILEAGPDVLNHNLETVARLYERARPQADYGQSLNLLQQAASLAPELPTKSGLMLGLGETEPELEQTLQDLRQAGCRILTLGQYLQPGPGQLEVDRFVEPEEFEAWRQRGLNLGFAEVASGPFVRSSYKAQELFART